MQTLLFKLLKQQLMAMAVEAFTKENVQAVFACLLTALKAAAVKSNTKIDDWILETLGRLATDMDAVTKFVDLVQNVLSEARNETEVYGDTPSAMLENQMAFYTARWWAKSAPVF